MHENGGVEGDGVVAELEHGAPPGIFDVALELGAEGAVVPGGVEAAVDFAALEEEAAALGEGEELVHGDGLGAGRQGVSPVFEGGFRVSSGLLGVKGSGGARVADLLTVGEGLLRL